MSAKAMYRVSGILFLSAAVVLFLTGQTALGAAFIALGASFVAISSTHSQIDDSEAEQDSGR